MVAVVLLGAIQHASNPLEEDGEVWSQWRVELLHPYPDSVEQVRREGFLNDSPRNTSMPSTYLDRSEMSLRVKPAMQVAPIARILEVGQCADPVMALSSRAVHRSTAVFPDTPNPIFCSSCAFMPGSRSFLARASTSEGSAATLT